MSKIINTTVNVSTGEITTNEIEANITPFFMQVPQTLTPRQARLALHRAGLLDEVATMLAADKEMEIWWEYSLDIQRNHEMVIALGTQLGLTEAQLDQLFVDGSKL